MGSPQQTATKKNAPTTGPANEADPMQEDTGVSQDEFRNAAGEFGAEPGDWDLMADEPAADTETEPKDKKETAPTSKPDPKPEPKTTTETEVVNESSVSLTGVKVRYLEEVGIVVSGIPYVDKDGKPAGEKGNEYPKGTKGNMYEVAAKNLIEALRLTGAKEYTLGDKKYSLESKKDIASLAHELSMNRDYECGLVKKAGEERGSIIMPGKVTKPDEFDGGTIKEKAKEEAPKKASTEGAGKPMASAKVRPLATDSELINLALRGGGLEGGAASPAGTRAPKPPEPE